MGSTLDEKARRILDGDQDAASWLYDTFAPQLLRRLARRYAYLTAADHEDILQDTFLLVLRNEARLLAGYLDRHPEGATSPAGLERFLWDQACGLASNRRRAAVGRRVVSFHQLPEPQLEPASEQRTIDRDFLAQLDACLRASGHRTYLYFKLRYRDGLSPEEIAQATGWSRKATYKLKQALNAALACCCKKLRRLEF